jgi:uncharacterized membrane protein YeaQ/YmgE (transglycosylase-associated protein family)
VRHLRTPFLGDAVHLPDFNLLVTLLTGLVAGGLAAAVIRCTDFGPIGDGIIGWLGALAGVWLLPRLGVELGSGIVALIANALIGAVALLLIVRVLTGRGILYRRRWGRGR